VAACPVDCTRGSQPPATLNTKDFADFATYDGLGLVDAT
jgi:hypothetical protein